MNTRAPRAPRTHAQEQLIKLTSELIERRSIIMYNKVHKQADNIGEHLEVEQALLAVVTGIIEPTMFEDFSDPIADIMLSTFAFALVLAAEHHSLAGRMGEYISTTSKFELSQIYADIFQSVVDEIDGLSADNTEQADVS